MQGPAKIATYIGNFMVVLGFGLIALAWNGAAGLDFIQGQFPYALSGGLGGLGLIVGGMAVIAIQTQRTITAQRAQEMRRLQDEVDQLIRLMIRPGPGEMVDDETIIDVGARTVVRTIDRRPVTQEEESSSGALSQARPTPAGGFAPAPRESAPTTSAPAANSDAEQQESGAPVAVLEREDDEAAWAAPSQDGTNDEHEAFAQALSDVSGVGQAKQADLHAHFGTMSALRAASVAQLADVPGISPTLARRIKAAVR